MKRIIFIFICLALGVLNSSAQDKMYLRGQKEPLKVKIIEVGIDEIKYKIWPATENDFLNVILKDRVEKIILQSGDVYSFTTLDQDLKNPENFTHQKANNFKIRLLSPLSSATKISYERSIRPGRSFEIGVSLVGLGLDVFEDNPSGIMVRTGLKFINTPDMYMRKMRYTHRLKGFYMKPEVVFGAFNVDATENVQIFNPISGTTVMQTVETRESITSMAALVNIGYQWILDDAVSIDWFVGLGYGFSTNGEYGRHFSFVGAIEEFPIAVSGGFLIGFLTK
jgi:hypothetical protein